MKDQSLKLKRFLQLVTLLSVVGVFSIAQAQIVVDLRVSANEDKLEFTTHGTCNGPHNKKGCVGVVGRVLINFNLTGNKNCSSGGKWALDNVSLSNAENGEPGNLEEVVASDFDADAGTGLVNLKKHSDNHLQIRDHNTEEYDIWYTVTATCAASGVTINSDPRIRNDGTG